MFEIYFDNNFLIKLADSKPGRAISDIDPRTFYDFYDLLKKENLKFKDALTEREVSSNEIIRRISDISSKNQTKNDYSKIFNEIKTDSPFQIFFLEADPSFCRSQTNKTGFVCLNVSLLNSKRQLLFYSTNPDYSQISSWLDVKDYFFCSNSIVIYDSYMLKNLDYFNDNYLQLIKLLVSEKCKVQTQILFISTIEEERSELEHFNVEKINEMIVEPIKNHNKNTTVSIMVIRKNQRPDRNRFLITNLLYANLNHSGQAVLKDKLKDKIELNISSNFYEGFELSILKLKEILENHKIANNIKFIESGKEYEIPKIIGDQLNNRLLNCIS